MDLTVCLHLGSSQIHKLANDTFDLLLIPKDKFGRQLVDIDAKFDFFVKYRLADFVNEFGKSRSYIKFFAQPALPAC